MKKQALIVLVGLLVLSMLASCNPKGEAAETQVEATQAQENAAAETEAPAESETEEAAATQEVEEMHCLTACDEITSENVASLQQVAQVGMGRITDIATSPDNAHLAVAVMAGVHVFDTQTLEELYTIADGSVMYSVAYAPDGSDLAIGSFDAVYFYDASTYEKRDQVEGAYGVVRDLVYSPDGSIVAAQADNRNVALVDPQALSATLIGGQNWFSKMAFSADGSQMFFSSSGVVETVSIPAGQSLGEMNMGACSNSGYVTLVEGTQNEVYACNTTLTAFTGSQVLLSNPAEAQIGSNMSMLAADPSGSQKIAAGRADGSVQVWDSASLEAPLWESPVQHPGAINSLAFLPNGTILFSASNTEVHKWDASSGDDMGMVLGFSDVLYQLSMSADGSRLVYNIGSSIYAVDMDACYGQKNIPTLLTELPEGVWSAVISSDQTTAAAIEWRTSDEGEEEGVFLLIIQLVPGGGIIEVPIETTYSSKHPIFSPNGQIIAVGVQDTVYFYDLDGNVLGSMKQEGDYVSFIFISPDGKFATIIYDSGDVQTVDMELFSSVFNFNSGASDYAYSAAISPDQSTLAVGYYGGDIRVYDLQSGTLKQTLTAGRNGISQLIFISTDLLISTSYDYQLVVWNVEDGSSYGWMDLTGAVYSMQLSSDGRLLAVGGYDGIIRFFGIPCEEEPSSTLYPALQTGALPVAQEAQVSQSCIVMIAPPSGGTITYILEEGFHKLTMPTTSTPDPKTTILWSNMKRAEESGGVITFWLEEGDTTVEQNADGSIKVTIPGCYPAP